MKSLMSYVLTKKEKAAIVVLLLLILLTGWYVGIYSPIQERIEAADTTDLEDAIAMEQVNVSKDQIHAAEIQENRMQMLRWCLLITILKKNWKEFKTGSTGQKFMIFFYI